MALSLGERSTLTCPPVGGCPRQAKLGRDLRGTRRGRHPEGSQKREARRRAYQAWMEEQKRIDPAREAAKRLDRLSNLVTDAVLLACGYHRPFRTRWRYWQDAERYA